MDTIVDKYLKGLHEHLSEEDKTDLAIAKGATERQLAKLKEHFPECPAALLQLLGKINGTYWQTYEDKQIAVLILGSDVNEYPYYLKSVEQIIEEDKYGESIRTRYEDYLDEEPELVGKGIDPDVNMNKWLCFADCMNNGGTSSLYIDFNPTEEGRSGQVVRFLHDPDSFKVIAVDFESYLQLLIEKGYDFIDPSY